MKLSAQLPFEIFEVQIKSGRKHRVFLYFTMTTGDIVFRTFGKISFHLGLNLLLNVWKGLCVVASW